MDSNTALAFCYTKAAGLLSKSYIKDRTSHLFNAKSLLDLWALLFDSPVPAVPEALLADKIEKKAFKTLLTQYISFLKKYDNPSPLLLSQLRYFEIENIQMILDSLFDGDKTPPKLIDLGGYSNVDINFYPDLEKMLQKTAYTWLHTSQKASDKQFVEVKMDLSYIKDVWNTIEHINGEDRSLWEKLFLEEYIIKNIVWAMRLSVYYQKSKDEILEELFFVTDRADKLDPIAGPAIAILDKDPNVYEHWTNWKYKKYLNPYEGGDWKLDPSWFERRYMAHSSKYFVQFFHEHPLCEPSLVAWFKVKLFELSFIRSAVESIRLDIPPQDAMQALGILA